MIKCHFGNCDWCQSECLVLPMELCKGGDLEGVKAALQNGADVNSKDEYGWTGLMWEVSEKHNSVVELLLKTSNIDVNQKDPLGCCALHRAVNSKKLRL